MSNLHNTTRLPLHSSMTNKSKSHLTNDLIERKTRALEGSLSKRKLTMQQNKTKSTIDIYRPIANKGVLQNATRASHDKPAVNSFSTIKQIIKCGQCDKDEAKMKCLECVEMYCSNCFAKFHHRGALQRHHCVLLSENRLSTLPKKQQSSSADVNLREFYHKQDLHRKITQQELEETENEKPSFASFQQSFLQWRDSNINKSKRNQQKRGLIPLTDELSNIDFNSSKTNPQDKFRSKKQQSKPGVFVNIHQSFSDNTELNDPSIDLEPSDDNLLTSRTEDSIEENSNNENTFEQNDDQERPITHVSSKSVSRPNSSSVKKDSIPSRPNSTTVFQPSLRSELATKSTDELVAIVDSQLILSRSSSATVDKLDQPSTILNLNHIPEHNTSTNTDIQSIVPIPPLDLSDKTKMELNHLSENILPIISERDESSSYLNSTRTGRNSPFSFSFALNKTSRMNSASSRDTGDGGFFTDFLPRQIISSPIPPPPPPIIECSSSNEWKQISENQPIEQLQPRPTSIPLRKLSVDHISRPSSKHGVILEPIVHHRSKSQTDNNSRPGSSLSSTSLPVSTTSSKADAFNDSKIESSATSSRKNSSSSTSTIKTSSAATTPTTSSSSTSNLKNSSTSTSATKSSSSATSTTKTSSSSTPKNSPPQPETTAPTIIEDKKVTTPHDNNECLPESTNSLKEKSSSNIDTSQNSNNSLKSSSTTCLTRDESITDNDILPKKKVHRRRRRRETTTSDEQSKFRKLGFSVGDGLKWQEASMESMSSTKTIFSHQSSNVSTPRVLTPSNPTNTKLAEQFSKYDNDDGRSSRTHQNVDDDECFNQLREELCSELDTRGSDEDALLNEHILKILRKAQLPLKENETAHQPCIDNELLIN